MVISTPLNLVITILKGIFLSSLEFDKNDFLFGLEFEFYFKSSDLKEKFIESINHQFNVKVLDLTHTQYSEDDEKWILSVERTMPILTNKTGMEITTPILEYSQIESTIDFILELIKSHGFTNDSCGFHFHLSTDNHDSFLFPDIIKFLLFLEDDGIFEDYHIRNNYAYNIMDVLKTTNLTIFRQWYKCLGKCYNIYFKDLEQKHIEIRILGSENYEHDETIFEFIESLLYNFYLSMTTKEQEKYDMICKEFKKVNKNQTLLYQEDLEKLAKMNAVSFEEKYEYSKRTRIMNIERRLPE